MAEFMSNGKALDRRGFLKGSALFAAAVGLSVASPAFAQGQGQEQKPAVPEEEKDKAKEPSGDQAKQQPQQPQQPSGGGTAKEDPNKLVDANGVEYRVCERCGGNMYKEGNTWTCEQCGLSYTE
jgi:hypothetical protein